MNDCNHRYVCFLMKIGLKKCRLFDLDLSDCEHYEKENANSGYPLLADVTANDIDIIIKALYKMKERPDQSMFDLIHIDEVLNKLKIN